MLDFSKNFWRKVCEKEELSGVRWYIFIFFSPREIDDGDINVFGAKVQRCAQKELCLWYKMVNS